MRTRLLLLLLLWTGMVWGQKKGIYIDSAQHIIYDFKTGDYSKDIHKIKVHTPVIFRIQNINPFVYKVTITPKDSVMARSGFDKEFIDSFTQKDLQKVEAKLSQEQAETNKALPNQAEAINTLDFKTDKKANATTEQEGNKKSFFAVEEIKNLKEQNEKFKDDIKQKLDSLLKGKNKDIDSLRMIVMEKKSEEVVKMMQDLLNKENAKDIKDQDKTTINSIVKVKDDIERNEGMIKEKDKLVNEKTKEYKVLLEDFLQKYYEFRKDCRNVFLLIRATKYIGTIADNPDLTYKGYQEKYQKNFKTKADELTKNIEKLDEYRKSYSDLGDAYFRLVSMNNLEEIMLQSGIDKAMSYPKFLKTKADQLSSWLSKYNWESVLRQAIWTVEILDDEKNFTIKSEPIQPENDMVQFTVNIAKKDEKNSDHFYRLKNFTYRQALYGGTRVDFSLGLSAAYYGKVSKVELLPKENAPSTYVLSTYKNKLSAASLIGMVTMSYRRTGYIAYGGSAGMGLDIAGGKVQFSNFFVGPTMLFGKKDRIFFTAGPSLKNVRELKNGYEGTIVPPTEDFTSYTRDKYKIGIFASLTYSLTKDARALIKNLR
ncbi:coiled-coil domain-containing protein [Epilithonimonas caeni]|uniref:coiled-coil domain-containing protein n=1 Tax=Epilithonimonas caeni TaxID=365343 RepID=UPI000406E2BA|nr:hypothetical protein [Epilithonimonas caeni]